jgi:hypothetical protein
VNSPAVKLTVPDVVVGGVDVNLDGVPTPLDLLLVINYLNSQAAGAPPARGASVGAPNAAYLDINQDGRVTPIDALLAINALNRHASAGSAMAEGERAPAIGNDGAATSVDAILTDELAEDILLGWKVREVRQSQHRRQ